MVVGALVYILLNFVARGVLSLLETLGTPIFLEYGIPSCPLSLPLVNY
jgi:hypothetical protein